MCGPFYCDNIDGREMVDDAIINSQESVITEDGQAGALVGGTCINTEKMPMVVDDSLNTEKMQEDEQPKMPQDETRSERLEGVIHLTATERNEAMAKKGVLKVTQKNLMPLLILRIKCYMI